jgi:murein DD-endopeptidase MepM/ murein hydrolase activator NlpD
VNGRKHQFSVPEVDHPDPARQVRRQETLHQRRKRAQFARLCDERLQIAIGREDPVEFWKAHGGSRTGRQWVQIILISDRLAKTRSVTLSSRHLVGTAIAALAVVCAATVGLYWLTLRYAADAPVLQQLVLSANEAEAERGRAFVQQNLNAMAVKLGEMQAQLTRLDALGERLSSLAGFRPQEFRFSEAPGLGGAAPTLMPPQNLSLAEFSDKLSTLARNLETRGDMMGVLEAQLFEQAVKKKMLPTMMPVKAPYNASAFGRRVDPFTGQWAMHEGIDFLADAGSPIAAAAAGVVVFSGFHPQYGYMVDIDHGNDLVTRYAHASKLFVKEGDVVQRGHKIGEVGSSGRSTGPHLHFEVRYRGAAQNPTKFLVSNSASAQARAK